MLRAEGLAVFRGERLVFRDLSLRLCRRAARCCWPAPNGAGKSTLLRLLAGLVRPAAGRVLWDGAGCAGRSSPRMRRGCAYLGHQDAVKPGLTATENLRFVARRLGRSMPERRWRRWAWRRWPDLPARMLSAGQKRRLALARLALSPAPLWLLDEPTLGLDAASIERFGALLAPHRAGGGLVVAATHLPLPLAGRGGSCGWADAHLLGCCWRATCACPCATAPIRWRRCCSSC